MEKWFPDIPITLHSSFVVKISILSKIKNGWSIDYPDIQELKPHSMHILQPSVIISLALQDGHVSYSIYSFGVVVMFIFSLD